MKSVFLKLFVFYQDLTLVAYSICYISLTDKYYTLQTRKVNISILEANFEKRGKSFCAYDSSPSKKWVGPIPSKHAVFEKNSNTCNSSTYNRLFMYSY